MLNQERVCEMTRLAIFDETEGQQCRPMIQYFRKDYIAKELLKSAVTGTAACGLLFLLGGLCASEYLMEQLNTMDLRQTVIKMVLGYAVFMAVYELITYMIYYMRYSRGRQKVKNFYLHLKKVNRLYRQEEQM